MNSPRHFAYFIALGMFWGMSPSLYKHLVEVGMPLSHTIAVTGLGVGIAMYVIAGLRSGSWHIPLQLSVYGAVCAFLMNIPFAINLFLAGHVPPTELAIVITLSPFMNYLLALATGWEHASPRRLLAIAAGFVSTLVLILSRDGTLSGSISWGLLAALSIPLLYCAYNSYAARHWPQGTNTLMAGAVESMWSGLFAVPLVAWVAWSNGDYGPQLHQYWILGAACLMWIVERIAYFTLISERGAVYTVQATYVSTPTAVVIAVLFFGGGSDIWLWVSLALLMLALWLNNSRGRIPPAENSTLDQHHPQPVGAIDHR
jgi:drug/metabolite transporter (DMT)-like permease